MREQRQWFPIEDSRVRYVSSLLQEEAADWMIQQFDSRARSIQTLNDFMWALRRRFEDPFRSDKAKAAILQLRQGTKNTLGNFNVWPAELRTGVKLLECNTFVKDCTLKFYTGLTCNEIRLTSRNGSCLRRRWKADGNPSLSPGTQRGKQVHGKTVPAHLHGDQPLLFRTGQTLPKGSMSHLRAHPYENNMFSPTNLIAALGLLLYGSRTDTAAEIEKVGIQQCHMQSNTQALGLRKLPGRAFDTVPDYVCEKPEGVHSVLNKVLKELNEPSTDYELSIANRLFADESITFFQKFLYCALKLYLTEVDRVDIHNAPANVRKLINLWVEIRTYGKIKNLLHKDSFNCEADLLLVNTLYFKGQWEVKFDKELTKEVPFYFNEMKCKNVQMMYRKGQYNTGKIKGSEVQVLEIPYKNNELSLFILLPKDCKLESLQQLEDELTHEKLLNWACILRPEEVHVAVPKLIIEKRIEANTYYLPHLTDPDKADMSGATSTRGAVLTHLFHDTFLEIDEEGGEEPEKPHSTKNRHLARRQPIDFVANHPFVYYVMHKSTQSLLAFGQFTKPE
uniref:serpin B3-like n=1 Tax=Euleptes europaea TaxID=460621 RepID=UPI00253FBA44|nr:serpin B3-like [Euleptes europaea]